VHSGYLIGYGLPIGFILPDGYGYGNDFVPAHGYGYCSGYNFFRRYGYGIELPDGYIPVAIPNWEESIQESEPGLLTNPRRDQTSRERISAPHWTHRGRTAGRGSDRDGEGEGAATPVVPVPAPAGLDRVPAGLDWMANGSARPYA